jgi:hypothetical protein
MYFIKKQTNNCVVTNKLQYILYEQTNFCIYILLQTTKLCLLKIYISFSYMQRAIFGFLRKNLIQKQN